MSVLLPALAIVALAAVWRVAVRPPTCTAPDTAPLAALVGLSPMFAGAALDKPVQLLAHPVEPDVWLIVHHAGYVERIAGQAASQGRVVLDIRDRIDFGQQWGLQQIALHPDFPNDPRVFVSYFGLGQTSVVAVYRTRLDGEGAVPDAEQVLFREDQRTNWHPIGGIAFGPDGYLYVGWGFGNADSADPRYLRGKLLRVDVDRAEGGKPYAIPDDNPFRDTDFDPAVYAIGFRNPWRFNFHPGTGEPWIGDVGEDGYEEIDRVVAGRDYGWPAWEGTACRRRAECGSRANEPPVRQHSHGEMCSAIGGYFYRGTAIAALRGKYVYGDTCTGMLWALDESSPASSRPIAHTGYHIASFAEDAAGELYVIASQGFDDDGNVGGELGRIAKIVAAPADANAAGAVAPRSLAELGCVAGRPAGTSAPRGMIQYAINHAAWEDGAEVIRFMTTKPLARRQGIEEAFTPPLGSVVLKTYLTEGRPTRTQMLARRADGLWDAHLYEWNQDGTDATPNPTASAGCARCHNVRVGMLRGLTTSQLNREFQGENQIDRLERIGTLDWEWKGAPLPVMPSLHDGSIGVELRSRAYLDVNCSACHQPGGETGSARFDLRFATPLALTGLCATPASTSLDDVPAALILAPGAPQASMLSARMHRTDLAAMPPGRASVDRDGTRVVDAWIRALASCPLPRE